MTSAQNACRPWTTGEIAEIRNCYYTEPTKVLAARLGRTVNAIRTIAYKVIPKQKKTRKSGWTADTDFILTALAQNGCTITECAAQLGRSEDSIRQRAALLGIRFRKRTYHAWTMSEIEIIREAAMSGEPLARAAEKLGTSVSAVRSAIHRYHIVKGDDAE